LPFVAFKLLTALGVADGAALGIAAVVPLTTVTYAWLTSRTVNGFGLVSIAVLFLAVVATVLTGDPRIILARGSVVTGVLGLACLASLLRLHGVRPLAFYLIRQFRGEAGSQVLEFAWQQRVGFRRGLRALTAAWGLLFITEAVVQVVLVYRLPLDAMVAISPALTISLALAIVGATVAFGRIARRGSGQLASRHA
jgi:hypothetical protein